MATGIHFEDIMTSLAYEQWRFKYEGLGIAEKMVSYLYSKLSKDQYTIALDVGCGTGFMTRVLAPHFSRVIGVDCSPCQIKVARDNTEDKNVTYREAGGENLDFVSDGSVDLIVVALAISYLEKDRFFAEADRVLKREGCLAMVTYDQPGGQLSFCTLSTDTGDRELDKRCQLLNERIIVEHDVPYMDVATERLVRTNRPPSPRYSEFNRFTVEAELRGDSDMFVGYLRSQGDHFNRKIEGGTENKPEIFRKRLLQLLSEVSPSPETVGLKLTAEICCTIYRKPRGVISA